MFPIQVFVGTYFGDSKLPHSTSIARSFGSHHMLLWPLSRLFDGSVSIGFEYSSKLIWVWVQSCQDPHHKNNFFVPQLFVGLIVGFVFIDSSWIHYFLHYCYAWSTSTSYLFNINNKTMFSLSWKHWKPMLLLLGGMIGIIFLSITSSHRRSFLILLFLRLFVFYSWRVVEIVSYSHD